MVWMKVPINKTRVSQLSSSQDRKRVCIGKGHTMYLSLDIAVDTEESFVQLITSSPEKCYRKFSVI